MKRLNLKLKELEKKSLKNNFLEDKKFNQKKTVKQKKFF